MPAVALTDTFLRALQPPSEGRLDVQDAKRPGLVLRVSASGVKSWSFRYRDKTSGKTERLTFGRYPKVSLAMARDLVDKRVGAIADGDSPRAAQRRARAEHAAGITFEELATRFLSEYVATKRPKSLSAYKTALSAPRASWGSRKAKDITRDDMLDFAERRGREAPIATNRSIAVLSKMFAWALDLRNPPVTTSPVIRIPKPGVERARTRTLRADEMPVIWDAFGHLNPAMGRVMKVLLLTGQRLSEVVFMRRDELLDLGTPDARWFLPGSRTKNKREHIVPLPSAIEAIIVAAIAEGGDDTPFVFVSRRNPGEPFEPHSFARAMKRMIPRLQETEGTRIAVRRLKAEPPIPHDLRRTVATGLGPLKVPREIIKSLLNHSEGDVTERHYDLYDRLPEKRVALDAWASYIERVAHRADSNVVPIRGRV